jgi:uncharacterized protein YndB with AHSA1/START domain
MADPVALAEMMIRRPVAEVFEAFANPGITSHFWFTNGTGRLEPGARVRWDWENYDFSVDVEVKVVEPGRRILVEWSGYGYPTPIEWIFTARPDGTTYVSVSNRGFRGTAAEKMKVALDSTEGFTFMLAGAKVWLEHGIEPNFVRDKFPDGLPEG